MTYDERVIWAIERHKPELLRIMKQIREDIGQDLIEVEFMDKPEERLRVEGSYPQLRDTDDPEPMDLMETIQNHLTAVYVVSFIVQQLTTTSERGKLVDSLLAGISDTGAEDGVAYAIYGAGSRH